MMKFLSAFAAVLFLLNAHTAYAGSNTLENEAGDSQYTGFLRCGTVHFLSQLHAADGSLEKIAALEKIMERPTKETYTDSEHFRVHYNLSGSSAPSLTDKDSNGIPDYVDSTLVYLEYSWNLLVVDMGYGAPRSDGSLGGGSGLIDCYLSELSGRSIYGQTVPDSGSGSSVSSYLEIDNNFTDAVFPTKGYNALKITTAHEFFHMIHYTYYGGYDAGWWMEQSAVWFEDRAWDDVNDYLNYIGEIFFYRDKPIDTFDNMFQYGATLFAMFIAENYGESYIKSVWSRFKNQQNGAVGNLNVVLPEGLPEAISKMSVWLYFTGARANTENFYHDADIFPYEVDPEYELKLSSDKSDSTLSFEQYTFKYVDLTSDNGLAYGDSLYYNFTNPDNGTWKRKVIFYSNPYNYDYVSLSAQSGVVTVPRTFDKAILALTNGSSNGTLTYDTDFYFTLKEPEGVENETVPEPFVLNQNYPNPFNNSTSISFSLGETSNISLRVYNSSGQMVRVLEEGILGPGLYSRSYSAENLSTGIYFIVLRAGGKTLTKKMTLLK